LPQKSKQINKQRHKQYTYGVVEASNETPLVIAAGDDTDDTDKSILLLLSSNDIEELDISSLSLTASSANLAKSKRFCGVIIFRFRDNDSMNRKIKKRNKA
jgi:hypothetical protein